MAITRATITKLTDLAGFKVNTGVGLSGRRRKAPSEVFNRFKQKLGGHAWALTDFSTKQRYGK